MESSRDNYICDITFFVPCHNEEDNVEKTLESICSAVTKTELTFEIIVVDDQSTDSTGTKVEEYIHRHPSLDITLITNEYNLGLGRNYIDTAFISKAEYYMLINGDNAEPEETISIILNEIGKADIIIPYFGPDDRRSFVRVLISLAFTWLINLLSGYSIRYYNGPVVHRRFNVMRWSPDTHGYAYQAELVVKVIEEGASYLEVKISNNDRLEGSSKAFTIQNILSVGHSILQIFIRRLRRLLFYKNT